jgi:hypothetical protein
MVAFNNHIRCKVVVVPMTEDLCLSRGAVAREILPWADPYVAQLIKNLQEEVRQEREAQVLVRRYRPVNAEVA